MPLNTCRENPKEKMDTVTEDMEEREQSTPKGRKTANSQGRRKGRITRSMANEASSSATTAPLPPPPPPPPPPAPPSAPATPVTAPVEEATAPPPAPAQEQSKQQRKQIFLSDPDGSETALLLWFSHYRLCSPLLNRTALTSCCKQSALGNVKKGD